MSNTAHKLATDHVTQRAGVVVKLDADKVQVRVDGSTFTACRAKSCLVAPEVHDRVILATTEQGGAWVLAVLEGDPDRPTAVVVDGELTFSARKVALRASEEASLATGGRLELTSAQLDVKAIEGRIGIARLTAAASSIMADVGQLKTVATIIETVAERVTERAKRLYRFVEDLERVRAGRMDVDAGKSLRMHAENSLVTAVTLVKVDGEHIHMG